jgi:hypothetical protein
MNKSTDTQETGKAAAPVDSPPTLDELRDKYEKRERPSRFHKTMCAECGSMVTNQAMGRKAHMLMHKRKASHE